MPIGNWPLDANQVIQSVYDTTENALRVNTQATITAGAMEVAIDASTDSIKVSDGTDVLQINPDGSINVVTTLSPSSSSVLIYGFDGLLNQKVKVDASGELQVDILSSALPLGAATSALQTAGNASLSSIDTKLTSPINVSGPLTDIELRASAVPVSVASLPLPSGAATEATLALINGKITVVDTSNTTIISSVLPTGASTSALQITGNSSLSSIDAKLTSPLSVTGPLTDVELRATPVPISGTVTANLGTIAGVATEVTLAALNTKVTVVDTSNVTVSSSVLPTGASTSALQSTGNASLSSIDSKLTSPIIVTGPLTDTQLRASPVPISGTVAATQSGTWILGNNSGVDIGDVTINNASGAAAVNIQDGGNSITVDGTVSTTQSGVWTVNSDDEKATFVTYASSIAIGNNKSMIAIMNGALSTVTLRLREIRIINVQTGAVTGVVSQFNLYRITSLTGGTAITPLSYDTNDALNVNITAATGGTVGGEAANFLHRWLWSSDDWGTGTSDVESNDHAGQNLHPNWVHLKKNTRPIVVRPGQGIHIKHVVNSTAGTFDLVFVFTQE